MAEQHQLAAINAQTEHSSIASNGRKRKITCDNDDNASDGCNDTLVVKRARKNDVNTVDAATNTADSAAAAVTDDDDFNQNPDNYITDDNSSSEQSKRATAQQNGQRSIEQDEAFKQGYVVVIPSMGHIQFISFILIVNFNFILIFSVLNFRSENDE